MIETHMRHFGNLEFILPYFENSSFKFWKVLTFDLFSIVRGIY